MATGTVPFLADNMMRLYNMICSNDIVFPEGILLSDPLKNLIVNMLNKNSAERFSIKEIKDHFWYKKNDPEFSELSTRRAHIHHSKSSPVINYDINKPLGDLTPLTRHVSQAGDIQKTLHLTDIPENPTESSLNNSSINRSNNPSESSLNPIQESDSFSVSSLARLKAFTVTNLLDKNRNSGKIKKRNSLFMTSTVDFKNKPLVPLIKENFEDYIILDKIDFLSYGLPENIYEEIKDDEKMIDTFNRIFNIIRNNAEIEKRKQKSPLIACATFDSRNRNVVWKPIKPAPSMTLFQKKINRTSIGQGLSICKEIMPSITMT